MGHRGDHGRGSEAQLLVWLLAPPILPWDSGTPVWTLCVCAKSLSRVQLFVTPWTVARQASLSMGFSRQKYWSGLPFPSPGDLPDAGIQPRSPALQADSLLTELRGKHPPPPPAPAPAPALALLSV